MNNYIITSDSTCDLPDDLCSKENIAILPVYYRFGDNLYNGENNIPLSEFYNRMRNGEHYSTIAPNIQDTKAFFEDCIKKCNNIIHIAFSSALSSTYQNACIAADEIMSEHPLCKIRVIDSLCASLGEGLLVYKAVSYKNAGHNFEETIEYIETVKLHIVHNFSVNDLSYLQKGGRISKGTAFLGELINIKPILHVNSDGELKMYDKVRGRKKSLLYLIDRFLAEHTAYDNDTIMISHCDCNEDVEFMRKHIMDNNSQMRIIINQICPTIGSHSGPGTIAIFYIAEKR